LSHIHQRTPETAGEDAARKAAQVSDRETWLARTLIELADIRVDDSGETEYASRLVGRLEELLRPDEVGLMLAADGGGLTAAAASSTQVRVLASFEERHGTGPCTRCHRSGQAALNRSLKGPGYAEAARTAGFDRVSALPLRRNTDVAGAIVVLHRGSGLEPDVADLAQVLAEAAAIAISRRRELRRALVKAEQLQRALDSRVLIEQAKGAVAARLELTPTAAFELLRAHARRNNLKLADVAAAAIAGDLTADLRAGPPRT
jgi:ANTAR domain/GAF domain